MRSVGVFRIHRPHPSADVDPTAKIGAGTRVWNEAQVRERARVGARCVLGKGAYLDADVVVGDGCRIQNYACVYRAAVLEDDVFVGPHAVLTNDRRPRAAEPDGEARRWTPARTVVRRGASIGASAVVLAGVEIGAFAMVGAGAVVTRDVPERAVVAGAPARIVGWTCPCGREVANLGQPECSTCSVQK